jgi:hypothetical protein
MTDRGGENAGVELGRRSPLQQRACVNVADDRGVGRGDLGRHIEPPRHPRGHDASGEGTRELVGDRRPAPEGLAKGAALSCRDDVTDPDPLRRSDSN